MENIASEGKRPARFLSFVKKNVVAVIALFAGSSCKENCSKGIRIFVWIVVGFMLLVAISSAVYFLIELIYSFL